jgi:DNA-binding transcriptional LysR family regulator
MVWDDIRYYLSVARGSSLADAARELGVSYSTVSRRLKALEVALGVRLFERNVAGYELSQAGAEMLDAAQRIEAEFMQLSRNVMGRDSRLSGRVRVATTDALAMRFMPAVAAFTRRYPDIEVDLFSTSAPADLAMRDAEVALLAIDEPPESLVGRRLARLPSALYASREYLEVRPEVEDLASHTWVGWEDGMEHIPLARWMRKYVPDAHVACRVRTGMAARAAVRDGLGIGHLLCFLADDDPELCRVSPPEPELETGLWLLTHAGLVGTGRIRAFLDFVADAIGRERAQLSSHESN